MTILSFIAGLFFAVVFYFVFTTYIVLPAIITGLGALFIFVAVAFTGDRWTTRR